MTLDGKEIDHIFVTDANGAVIAGIQDGKCLLYGGAQIFVDAEYTDPQYPGDTIHIKTG